MDNLSSHKHALVRDRIEATGATLRFLPLVSPDFDPIKKAFWRLKAMLRKIGERTVSGLWDLRSDRQARRYLPAPRVRQLLQFMRI